MYALTDFACFKAMYLQLVDMLPSALMSKILALLPADHQAGFFFHRAFLQRLPSDVRAHLVHDRILRTLSFALPVDKIYRSYFSSSSALHHVSSPSDECSVLADCASSASPPCSQCSPTPRPRHHCSQPLASTTRSSDSPSLCWYHRNHTDQAQKGRAPCFWSGN